MSSPRVLCLGEILWDCLADQVGLTLDQVQSWTPYAGGAPANTACGLVKLGTSAGFIGAIGRDEPGQALVQLLETVGVNTAGVQRHPTAPTRQVYVIRSLRGEREFAGFGGLDPSQFADAFLQPRHLWQELFIHADFLVLGTLELAYPDTREAIFQALDWAKVHRLQVMIDVNWRPMFWPQPEAAKPVIQKFLRFAHFVKLAREEAEWLFDSSNPGTLKTYLPTATGIIVTDGERGCRYYLGGQVGEVPGFRVPVVDTTGAGDGFWAGFIHQLCQGGLENVQDGERVREMIRFANGAGALTTLKPGAIDAQPTEAEVITFLATQS